MSGLFGGGNGKGTDIPAGGGYQLTGGGTGAPWSWGVSDFDQSLIDTATGETTSATQNRYNQLGLGGSTMEGQDTQQDTLAGQALTGQEQTTNVSQPALNPALQPQLDSLIGTQGVSNSGASGATGLGQLAGLAAGQGANLLGGGAGEVGSSFAGDADLGAAILGGV